MNKTKDYSKYFSPSMKDARKRKGIEVQVIDYKLDEDKKHLGDGLKYHLKTYGCQGNLADSEKLAGMLEQMGYTETMDDNSADVIIFNNCAIRANAENRVFGELGRIKGLKKKRPNLVFGLCGCMMQEEETVEMIRKKYPYVDLIFGTHNIANLPEYIAEIVNNDYNKRVAEVFSVEGDIYEGVPQKRDHPYKAWVNIMYGCDEFCTYCIVPYTRGKERSREKEAIIEEVEKLVEEGYQEVTLLGQNVNAYGKDFVDINYTFADLLRDLQKTAIKRIRFTTSHPRDLDDETIKVMASGGNIMPSLHLPVQSGSNEILKKMNRKYTKEEYLEKIKKLKTLIPGISITTDIIVAFPGETESDFEETLSLVREVEFEGAYTFIYSPREGTPAAKYPNPLTEDEKKARLLTLNQVVNEYYLKGNKRFENQVVEVLVEGVSKNNKNMMCGYSAHNKLVNFKGSNELVGKIVKIKVTRAYSWHLFGELCEENN